MDIEQIAEKLKAACFRARNKGTIEIEPRLGYELLGRRDAMVDMERGPEEDWLFCGMSLKPRPHLKGWRVTGQRWEGVWPTYVPNVGEDVPDRPQTVITSADFDETESINYEAARERSRQAYHRAKVIHALNPSHP